MSSRKPLLLTVCAALGACGNYSNDDLDFQLALPDKSDLSAQMQLSVTRLNSAEYYRATRTAVTAFNDAAANLAGLVDLVRGLTPTTRNGDVRTWGPWPADKHPDWQLRLVMQRSTDALPLLHMDYWLQVRPAGQGDAAWISLLTGQYTSAGSARTGQGEVHLITAEARAAGYPLNDDPGIADLDHLDVTYSNAAYPVTVTMDIVKLPPTTTTTSTTKSGHYEYALNQDGAGHMSFDWNGTTETGQDVAARMVAQWIGSGAGRADLTADLTPSQPDTPTLLGTDCWGVDSLASYSYRITDTANPNGTGDPTSCLF
jgi:hypothetical protein